MKHLTNTHFWKLPFAGFTPSLFLTHLVFILSLVLAGLATIHAQNTYTWNGGSGNWSDNNWNCVGAGCGNVPTATDNAIVNSGVITIDAPVTINDLTVSGSPDFNGANSLTVNGTLKWIGCDFYDIPINVEGTLDLTDGSGFGKYMYGTAVLTLNGTTNHSSGRLFFKDK